MKPFQNKTIVLEIWCYQSVEWKKFFEIVRNGHGIFSQLARLWRPWCFYFLRLGGFSKAEGGLWNLKFLMHLWSFYECRFEIIFGLAKYFKLTFKHKPCFHAKRILVIFQLLKHTRQLLFLVCCHNFLWSPPTKLQIYIIPSWSIWMVHLRLSGPWTTSSRPHFSFSKELLLKVFKTSSNLSRTWNSWLSCC